ncbi:MAG: RlpA-like double-psi beta-barrel domain-containing protein [Patescibacteria group bacterium]|jgi:D-alanyl-D-alanine endopeptidase (penicillin-binding protein 7)
MFSKSNKYFWLFGLVLFLMPLSGRTALAASLNITYVPEAFTAPAILNIATSSEKTSLPWQWKALTPAYDYSLTTDGFYDPSRPMRITINYTGTNNYLKQIFIFDSSANLWRPLPTTDFPSKNQATAMTTSVSGRLLIAANSDMMTIGTASWYKYKNGLFAASPDFAKGSVLKVINLDNNKSVNVIVNDYGPERAIFPNRVVDLDYVAFKQIASTGAGLIKVRIEPLKIVGSTLNKPLAPTLSTPALTASSAVIMLEKTGEILWGKNQNKISPLASLSKLVAMRVFLDTRPSLNKVVAYKVQDENYNSKYCSPSESARIRLRDGETVTIQDLIYSSLVGSANNAVESLVRVSGLSRPNFIKKMNELVKTWGATNTVFVEPTGLSPNNVSSPQDYAIITKEVFTNPLLQKISTTLNYTFKTINTKIRHSIKNTDKLLQTNTYKIIGSKTGYLDEAKYCLMTRVQTPQGNLISVNFGSTSQANNFLDNEQLIRYGLSLFKK